MDALQEYANSEESDEHLQPSSVNILAAPDVPENDEPERVVALTPAQQKADLAANWNPAGTAHYFAVDDGAFRRQERSLGRSGTCEDPATGQRKQATTVFAAHPESRVHSKREFTPAAAKRTGTAAAPAESAPPKRARKGKKEAPPVVVPTSELHVGKDADYLGRSWMHPPAGSRTFEELEEYTPYIPKQCVTEFAGAHARGASAVRFLPGHGHLLLSAGLDGVAKVWDAGKRRRCIRSYSGHSKGIRDVCFSGNGRTFLTASYDRSIKLWDTETGRVVSSFDCGGSIPLCARFHPDDAHRHEFLAGCMNKKVIQLDVRDAGNVVQQYDQHMGAVNSVTFVDDNRRFVSSADDKVLRVWEYGIPVVIKYISDPKMHSMPVVASHPNRKWLACQGMDNRVTVFSARDRFKLNAKKSFRGHIVAGYACGLSFSPDGRFLASGDSTGRAFFWDWKTARMFRALQAHKGVCVDVNWHPTQPSLVATCGWDGNIKLWD